MPMTPKHIVKYLERNEFKKLRQDGTSHAIYYNKKTDKITTVQMHNKDLKKGTEHRILKDAGLK